ncbi:MAG: hypothetical protein IPQ19_13625 [Bacteroidetes bacterium]|nr:hypothetical protein [Bacteroidota bacterium]
MWHKWKCCTWLSGAKNIIDVGLVDAVDVHITSSVFAYDGRLKPEIVALGSMYSD